MLNVFRFEILARKLTILAALASGVCTQVCANVVLSAKPTKNMSCVKGVCTPTKAKAILNVSDLASMLASSDVKVVADTAALDIDVSSTITWSSVNRLTLDAYHSIRFTQPLIVAGQGGLKLITNRSGADGDFYFLKKGRVEFRDLSASLGINGKAYVLVSSIAQLQQAVAGNPDGFFALSATYNAARDGTYNSAPIPELSGVFEGLGNHLSNLAIDDTTPNVSLGFISVLDAGGAVRDLQLVRTSISGGSGSGDGAELVGSVVGNNAGAVLRVRVTRNSVSAGQSSSVGGIAGLNTGSIVGSAADGTISGTQQSAIGGIAGTNNGFSLITQCAATETVTSTSGYYAGGLVGRLQNGTVSQSYAMGAVSGASIYNGGLVGSNSGNIEDSYAMGSVTSGAGTYVGGLVGSTNGTVSSSYSIGHIDAEGATAAGGFLGNNLGVADQDYWDLDTSGFDDPSEGCGDVPNCQGVTGLTSAELQSALPQGFSPTIWDQKPNINNGFPYLLANAPQ